MANENLPGHIRAFFNPASYPHPVKDVQFIQTHISWIFLTGEVAYKIKKPVDLGFVNFSTLVKRKKTCEAEISLNRRLAPDIYLDLLSIYKEGDAYRMGGNSNSNHRIIDYAIKMVQFSQHDLFDVRLQQGHFNPAWMDQLASLIANFHKNAEPSPEASRFGDPKYLLAHIQASLKIAEEHLGSNEMMPILASLKNRSRDCFEASQEKLRKRQQQHHIRNCHGDLHLKNIALFNNRPTPFDCIEFNDEFRMIDTMNDTAFLVMDCASRGRPDLGYRFLSRYLEHSGDYEGLQLLHLYLSYRAGVRGKVSCLSAITPGIGQDEREALLTTARHYFTLAEQYLRHHQPRMYMLGGLSGSGKSHLALQGLMHGSKHERAIIIRSDATRKRIAKDHMELPLYSKQMHQLTYRAMFDATENAIKAGFSVILDATFLHPASRKAAANIATRLNTPLHCYWLDIDEATLKARVKQRHNQRTDISDADLSVLEAQLRDYRRPDEPWVQFITNSGNWPG